MIRPFLLALFCSFAALTTPAPLLAQGQSSTVTAPDYDAWRNLAERVERLVHTSRVSDPILVAARDDIVAARSQFLTAQGVNATRISATREQLAALGPAPAEGVTEAPEIATRRAELVTQLAELEAPVIAAQEAFQRADGLVRQIDTLLRERQAEALLTLSPTPVNPAYWPEAIEAIYQTTITFVTQTIERANDPAHRREFVSNLPVVVVLVLFSAFVLMRGRNWIEKLVLRLYDTTSERTASSRRALALILSLAQIVAPVVAILALTFALETSGMLGPIGQAVNGALFMASIGYFTARWAGRQNFPVNENAHTPLRLPDARRREGRVMANLVGLFLGLYFLLRAFLDPRNLSDEANSVIGFPLLVLAGIVLVRIGMLLVQHRKLALQDGIELSFLDRVIGVLGRAAILIGCGAPVFAAIGYVQAAEALLFPAIVSLGLITALIFLNQLVDDMFALLTGRGSDAPDALAPALISFGLVIVSMPVFALVWGVRTNELAELWQLLQEGFRIGETRIAPTNILYFAIVFGAGYMLTRLMQGALASTVLPKTKIDKGGQKAIISGTGYVGIFIAALVAISTAGIDLSGLAIVAGALSVGIGFGLQNIVSNFISGVILLIERPVAEGDWIEVGGTMGTVRSISVRSTVIETFDKTDVIVPNADLISGTVTNWTRYNSLGRITIAVGVAYGSDTRKVEAVLREIAEAQPLAVLTPPPLVLFTNFGADSLDFEIRIVLSDVTFANSVRTEIRHQITERFRDEGIEIPFAQRDVWLRNPEALTGGAKPAPAPAPVTEKRPLNPPQRGGFEDLIEPDHPSLPSQPDR
jgi:potassium-dependent mechanosensitive channel